MTRLTLRYAEDPETGLPRLHDQSGSLSAEDLDVLGREIDRNFERLASGPDSQILALNGPCVLDLPPHFRVCVTERDKRCPTLLLEATDPSALADAATSPEDPAPGVLLEPPGRWQGQFVAEAAELVARLGTEGSFQSPLDFVLADLRALRRKDPQTLTLLLLAGYLHVGDALSMRHGEPGDNRYARAAWALAQRAGTSLPEGALDPLLPQSDDAISTPASAPERPTGWLRRFFSFF